MNSILTIILFFHKAKCILTLLFILAAAALSGQSNVTGVIKDDKDQAVPFANVLLLSAVDSSLIKGGVAGDNGHFEIKNIASGTYILRGVMVGFGDHYSETFDLSAETVTRDFGVLVLQPDVVLMNTVEVVGKRALFEQKIDRMVVNVANSITSSGTNALEVLERCPGVVVNRQSNTISVSGKNGVVVMINGRINYMPSDAVVRMLEGMSSDDIDRIEVITTPPAGFDAEGNAGYINIVLKNILDEGFNGSFGAGLGYGKGVQANANMNFNYRKGKINLYGNYSYARRGQEQVFEFYRRIFIQDDQLETDTRSVRQPKVNNHNARVGFDYQLSSKTVMGFMVSGYNNEWTMKAQNISLVSRNGALDTSIHIKVDEINHWKHAGANANVQHTFSEGRVLRIDADMLWYHDNNPTGYENEYSDGQGNFLFEKLTRSRKLTPINIKVGKIDYTSGLGKKMKMETGVKGTISHFTNDVGVDYLQGQLWVNDPDLTANFDLDEEILAAYLSLETPLAKGIKLKAGLRCEYTNSHLGSIEQPDIVDRQFGELFPSVFLSKEFDKNNSVNLAYSKRITRATFNDMAPFAVFVDPYTFFSGNPALQPALADNFKLGYRHKTFLVSLDYSLEDSTIARFQTTVVPGTNRQLIFAENLKGTKVVALTLAASVTPLKWWNMYYNINAKYQKTQKYIDQELQSFEASGIGLNSTQTITLPKNFTFELSGNYTPGGLFGIAFVKPTGSVNVGLQKKFNNNGGTLRLGYDDLFDTRKVRGETNLPEQNQLFRVKLRFSQPTVKISYSKNFGNQKVKAMRDRKTGAEEERERVTQ